MALTHKSNNIGIKTWADPKSFVRGGPLFRLFSFFLKVIEWREDPITTISAQSSVRQWNGVSLACRWWPNTECWLGSFVIFQGIRTSIAKKPYIFVINQGWSRPLVPSPLWIHAWKMYWPRWSLHNNSKFYLWPLRVQYLLYQYLWENPVNKSLKWWSFKAYLTSEYNFIYM